MSIATCLLNEIVKKIYQPDFLQINKSNFKSLFVFIDVAMATSHTSAKFQKTEVSVVNLLVVIFVGQRIKGLRGKSKWNTVTKNCVRPPEHPLHLFRERQIPNIKDWNKLLLFDKPLLIVAGVEMLPKRTWKEKRRPVRERLEYFLVWSISFTSF